MNNCSLTKPHTVEISIIMKCIIITLKRKKKVKNMYLIFKVTTGIMLESFGFL